MQTTPHGNQRAERGREDWRAGTGRRAAREASVFQSEAAPSPLLLDVVCGGVARSRGRTASEANKVCGEPASSVAAMLGSGGAQGPEAGPASSAG